MIAGPLDIPDEIVAAIGAGELVIFAGAGISCGGRSNLPSFSDLAEKVRTRIAQPKPEPALDADVQLGEWMRDGGAVHDIAHEIISASPGHNPIHEHILQLFPSKELIRIVTTNFDRHFTSAAKILCPDIPIYRAPALPLGHDFHGIVYLHGSVDDRADRLVLTDADFGRAYLSEGWARTFLQGLYAKFHVLFIGYSHGDVLLTYLAKGLSQHVPTKRHAFQLRGGEKKWKRINVTPIPYGQAPQPGVSEDHTELGAGIARWFEILRQKPSDEFARLRAIITNAESPAVSPGGESDLAPAPDSLRIIPVQLSLDEADFVRRVVSHPEKVAWFITAASSLRWVAWVHENKLMEPLSDGEVRFRGPPTPRYSLSAWALKRLMADPVPGALELFARLGGRFGPDAWQNCILEFVRSDADTALWSSDHLEYWLVALRDGFLDSRRHDSDFLGQLIIKLAVKGLHDHALGLFTRLLRVRVEWQAPIQLTAADVSWRSRPVLFGDLHQLIEVWQAFGAIRSQAAGRSRLFHILSECVEDVYSAFGPRNSSWDELAGLRIVVDEARGSFDPSSAEGFLVEMLCQLIKEQAATPEGISEAHILLWLGSPRLLWRRLGYLALRETSVISPDRKAQLIIDLGLAYPNAWQLQHDPRALLVTLFGAWSPPLKQAVIERVVAGPSLDREDEFSAEKRAENAERLRDSLLNSLALRHPADLELVAIFHRLGRPMPASSPTPSPESGWEYSEARDLDQSPIPVSEILRRPIPELLDDVLAFKEENRWASPTRHGYRREVVAAANQNRDWARDFILALAQRSDGQDLWEQLGWGLEWLKNDGGFRRWFLLELLPASNRALWSDEAYRGWSSRLLGLADAKLDPAMSAEEWVALTRFSEEAWGACGPSSGPREKGSAKEALQRAINHPAGHVIEFWLSMLRNLRRREPTAPYEWPANLRPLVDDLLSRHDDYRLMCLAIFGQQLRFLRYALPEWTQTALYPRLDFSVDAEQAECLWSALLLYGNWSYELAQDLTPLFTSQRARLFALDEECRGRFLSVTAAIATGIAAPGNTLQWLLGILRDAEPQRRAWWVGEVARSLREADEEQQKRVWSSWARNYLRGFREGAFGDPARAEAKDEFEQLLDWPLAFLAIGVEPLELLMQVPTHRIERLDVIYQIEHAGLAAKAPDLVARYLRWVSEKVCTSRFRMYGVDDVIAPLVVARTNRDDLQALSERLLQISMTEEHQMLVAKLAAFDASQQTS